MSEEIKIKVTLGEGLYCSAVFTPQQPWSTSKHNRNCRAQLFIHLTAIFLGKRTKDAALQTFEDASHPHPICITKVHHFLTQTEKIVPCLTNRLVCVFLNFIKIYLVKILIIQNVKVFSLTLAGKANFYIISFLLQTSACIYSIGVLTWDSQIEMLLHWQLCVAITHWSIRMHQLVNVALLCNLCLLWKYLQAIVSWFWKTWSFHVVRQILSLHYFMWKDSSRQSIFCPFILCPSTQRLTFLCFIKILTRCAFMLCWHLISLLLFSVHFQAGFSRPQVHKEQIMRLFLSTAEQFILLNALFRCLYRRFNPVSTGSALITRRWATTEK